MKTHEKKPFRVDRARPSLAWAACLLALSGCGVRKGATPDATAPLDAAVDAPATRLGASCAGDDACDGLRCATRFERSCNGPIRPHQWTFEFPGGWCHPPVDLARGDVLGGCPAGTDNITLITGCDGVPFRFCTVHCASDRDCREAEGYRCNLEALLCYPPALVSDGPEFAPRDAGLDGD